MIDNKDNLLNRWRTVRVFISSTFRDMQEERDYLVKFVFPELRKRCHERGVEFVEVDLRWGVTEEQVERGEVLPICMAEIDNCRPYFIGLLGERYGYVPQEIDPELIKSQPWLARHSKHSVTALEILHGVLNKAEMADHAFFYFRAPSYIHEILPEKQANFAPENAEAAIRLSSLKALIRESGFHLKDNYPDPETAGKLILEDLWQVINQAYPPGSEPDPLDRDAADHDAFAESRASVYIGRPEYFDRLDAHVEGENPPLVLVGDSGVGKSALIANWVRHYKENHPDAFMILHFIGSTPQSADYEAILARIMGEIKRHCEIQDDIPVTPEKLREAFPLWLGIATAKGPMVLVLDALNQLEDRDNALDLGWLPDYFPPNIHVILTSLPGRSMAAIEKRGWPTYEVYELNSDEKGQMINKYLSRYRKALDQNQIGPIKDAPQTANPLYLKVLLEELRIFGKYEMLNQRIAHYLEAPAIPDLYGKVLERLEQDYEKDRPGLVKDTMSLLWAARRGLSEMELMEMLGTPESPLPRLGWAPMHLAILDSLVERSGLLGFFHDYLRQAVHERYLGSNDQEKAWHLRLADYFSLKEANERKADELPWQLLRAKEWERLKMSITEIPLFLILLRTNGEYELMGYWLSIGDRYEMVSSYNTTIERYEKQEHSNVKIARSYNSLAFFFSACAEYDGAEPLFRRALGFRDTMLKPEHPEIATSLTNLAALLYDKGDFDGAEPLYRRALAINEKALGPEHPNTAQIMNNLAGLFESKGDFDSAEPLYRQALAIREKVLGPEHPDTAKSLNGLATLLYSRGDYGSTEYLFHRALAINEKALGPEHPNTAQIMNNLAGLFESKGDFDSAEPLYRQALAIREKVLGPEHPDTAKSLNGLAALLYSRGDYDSAEPLYRRALTIREKMLGLEHPDMVKSINDLAVLLNDKGDFDSAEPLYRQALAIREKVLGSEHKDTAAILNNLALLLFSRGDYDSAEPLYRRALAIREKVLGPEHKVTAQSVNDLAVLLFFKDDYDGAEPLYRRALAIRENALGSEHPDTVKSMNFLAELLFRKGDYDGTEPLYRRALAIREKVLGPEHPDTAQNLHDLATLLFRKRDYDGAEPLYRRALTTWGKVLGPEHPDTEQSVIELSALLIRKGDYDGAEPLLRRALAIKEKAAGPEHPDTAESVNLLASVLFRKGDYDGAEPLFRRALEIREKVLGPLHPDTTQSVNNLAVLVNSKGDYDGAEPLYRRALAIREKVLGLEHLDTAASLNGLAALLYSKGDYDSAEPLFRRTLAIRVKVLGLEHPDTVKSVNELAQLLKSKED